MDINITITILEIMHPHLTTRRLGNWILRIQVQTIHFGPIELGFVSEHQHILVLLLVSGDRDELFLLGLS
jgi:hypothetical protein